MDMLKQVILVVVTAAALTSAYLMYKSKTTVVPVPNNEALFDTPVTSTEVGPT